MKKPLRLQKTLLNRQGQRIFMDEPTTQNFSGIRNRLEEIATQVRGDELSLDNALDLYDEAVKLSMKATELLENIDVNDKDGG